MRRRLVITYLLLLCMVLLALEVPLAATMASRETDRAVADRLADATRFASLAAEAVRSGDMDAVNDELRRYQELYGIGVMLFDQDQVVLSAFGTQPAAPAVAVRGALAGHQVSSPETLWPWEREPLTVAVPISDGGAVLGVVLTVSPTDRSRRDVLILWLLLTLVGAVAVAACVTTADRLASWVLRPVTRLDAAAHEIAGGDSAARVVPGLGPPELRRLSASFNEMADAVAEAMERQRSFVAHASHQLRNPLTVLRLRIEDMGSQLDDEDLHCDREFALEETDRLAGVLDGLLELAQAERGRPQTEIADATALAADRVKAWQPLAERRDVELVAELPDCPMPARLVPTALDQSLDALIDNALKFTPSGGRVVVRLRPADGGAEVSVCDTGPGMTEEQCRQATERFWRAADAQNVDGAGLGLSIVAVLVEASGGRFTLSPAETGGLNATIRFRA